MRNITINANEEAIIVIKNPDGKEVYINICMMQMNDKEYYRDIFINREYDNEYSQDLCCVEVSEKDDIEVSVAADENREEYTNTFTIKPTPEEEPEEVAPVPTTPAPRERQSPRI